MHLHMKDTVVKSRIQWIKLTWHPLEVPMQQACILHERQQVSVSNMTARGNAERKHQA